MAGYSMDIVNMLMELQNKTYYSNLSYPIVQYRRQRKFGPPPDWDGSEPPKGCEVFIGKLPRDIFEDELVPVFSRVGKIYELRLMMYFSGSNRGFAFVTYCTRAEAFAAVKQLNNYEIRNGRRIAVMKSHDNCRLFVGNIPVFKTKDQVLEELSRHVTGIVDVILYKNRYNRNLNRGFAFVEFTSHRATALALETIKRCIKLWDRKVMVNWATPKPDVDDEQMKRQHNQEHARQAMIKLQNVEIDGSNIEITWPKPVHHELYQIQKMNSENFKFNNMEACVRESTCASPMYAKNPPMDVKTSPTSLKVGKDSYTLPPAKLDTLCTSYMWSLPIYNYQKIIGINGIELWVCRVVIPHVGLPLWSTPRHIGPLITSPCFTPQAAHVAAAQLALNFIQMLQTRNNFQQALDQYVYSPVGQTVPKYLYNRVPLYARAPSAPPMSPPAIWRTD